MDIDVTVFSFMVCIVHGNRSNNLGKIFCYQSTTVLCNFRGRTMQYNEGSVLCSDSFRSLVLKSQI